MEIHHRQDFVSWLEANAEPAYAQFSVALIPGLSKKLLGIRIPKLRSMARDLAKKDLQWVMREVLTTDTFEEVMLRGFVIGSARVEWAETWEEIRKFVPLIDNWSVCDFFISSLKVVQQHREEVWPFLIHCLGSSETYEQRFAVVMMMEYYLTDEYIEPVLKAWSTVKPNGYYVEMAIGWGLAESFLSFQDQTMEVLLDERVPLACRKKACQKILESRRTPHECRAVIKELKSKY